MSVDPVPSVKVPPFTKAQIREFIAQVPRVSMAALPTPLQEAKRLSEVLGGPRIFIKRDDLTGMAFGGNKTRNLEFRLMKPIDKGADVLIMALGLESNSARQTVGSANRLGMDTVLVLIGDPPAEAQGNLLVDYLLGAEIHFAKDEDEQAAIIQEIAETKRREGRNPMVLTNEPIFDIGSALAYLECTIELLEQMEDQGVTPDYLYMTSAGKGQAGLILAKKLLEADFQVHGVTQSDEYDVQPRTARIANDTLQFLGLDLTVDPSEITSFDDYVGDGYGKLTEAGLDAMKLAARTEGVILDPIYTGKTMAGLVDHVRKGLIPKNAVVVFIHTGGTPAMFTHSSEVLAHLKSH